ncbi:HAD family hydrolase [Ruicaihuangia caeni]|uniref:HAD family phosphatase n=1 Tax=Ruicaihuangia caeni TaxID=3042517 RepID=A0AAW6T522_9MICO|nr:HAD family phosphatase [Klugiella sp. YN-L-19]MDI2098191.1 HAD family phosphatase [Klugiella sp. YN-L-19]
MTTQNPAAILWDMDGTIVDTEPYWMEAEVALVREYGGEWGIDDAKQLIGQGLWHSARLLRSKGVAMDEAAIIDELTDRVMAKIAERVPWRPGARELLSEAREAGLPMALVTMSFRRMADQVVEAIGFEVFDAIVTGDSVDHAKPHPQPYLLGAESIGVDAADSVAIEDSEPGLRSAVAAGATAIGVLAHAPIPESEVYTLWPTLEGRVLADLAELHGIRRAA